MRYGKGSLVLWCVDGLGSVWEGDFDGNVWEKEVRARFGCEPQDRTDFDGLDAGFVEPDSEAEISEEKAEANRIVPGKCDYYSCGDYTLQLYSDESGTLVSIVVAE